MKKISLMLAGAVLAMGAHAQNVAVVNGKPIPKSRLDAVMADVKQRAAQSGNMVPPDMEKRLADSLITSAVVAQAAEAKGLHLTPEYRAKMEVAREGLLGEMLMHQYMKEHQPSDAEAKAFYDEQVASAGLPEYHASHILVKTEAEARKLLGELKKGAAFASLAKKHSQDPGSAKEGGSLGWAPAEAYVPPFAAALKKLKKGETATAAVKSEFGFHIIHVHDTREGQVPSFDEVKDQIKQQLGQREMAGFQKFVDDLRKKARIQ